MKLSIFICFISYITGDYATSGEEFDDVACNNSTAPRILDATNGVLTSPNYPDTYPRNMSCTWRIQSNHGDRILLAFVRFFLVVSECSNDYVAVYDSDSEDSSKLLGKFCGFNQPFNLTSTANYLFVKFVSGSRNNFNTGFKASYSADGACDQQQLPRHIYGPIEGMVSTPFHPEKYVNNLRCAWLFHAEDNVLITRTKGYLVYCENCENCDHLSIYNGTDNTAPLLYKLCGSMMAFTTYTSGGDLYFEFITDGSVPSSGFTISYQIISKSTTSNPGLTTGTWTTPPSTTRLTTGNWTTPPSTTRLTTGTWTTPPSTTHLTTGNWTTPPSTTRLTTGTWTTPPSTTPSFVTPPELDVYVTGTFETPSQTNISDNCMNAYTEELRKTLSSMGYLLNLELGQSLCRDNTQFAVYQTSVIYLHRDPDNAYKGSTRLAVLLAGDEGHSFRDFHSCSYQVSSYIADHGNWGRPLLSQLPGCPFLQFTPEMFTQSDIIWRCSS